MAFFLARISDEKVFWVSSKKAWTKFGFWFWRTFPFFAFLLLDSKCFWERYLCVCQFFQIQLCFLVLGFGFNWNIINTKAFSCALYTRKTLLLCCTFLWVFFNWLLKKFFSKSFRPDLANSSRDAQSISATLTRSWLSLRCNRAFFKVGLTSFMTGQKFVDEIFMGCFPSAKTPSLECGRFFFLKMICLLL